MAWILDPAACRVGFSVRHMVIWTVRGHFKTFRADAELDEHDFTRSRFRGEIDVASIDTGSAERDRELRTNEFFCVSRFPTIAFESQTIEPRGRDRYVVHGDLTVRGVTKRVAVDVVCRLRGEGDARRANLEARANVNRKTFGVCFSPLLETGSVAVGDDVTLEVDLAFARR